MSLGFFETLLIVGIIVLVFGVGKLPTVMGDVGRALRTFKDEMRGDGSKDTAPAVAAAPPAERGDRPA
ncbi:MAG TPA: twin-arginine translocase TatA/TatE family subunit [Azospirillaceae bacterium]|nr:twin-arginine translocase TatA/TatE family subunit [Azospirillaceae bacterium]